MREVKHLRSSFGPLTNKRYERSSLLSCVSDLKTSEAVVDAIYRPTGSPTTRGLGLSEENLRFAVVISMPVLVKAEGDFNFDRLNDTSRRLGTANE